MLATSLSLAPPPGMSLQPGERQEGFGRNPFTLPGISSPSWRSQADILSSSSLEGALTPRCPFRCLESQGKPPEREESRARGGKGGGRK
ncbi:Wee1-like protein kinase 1-B, partial [Ophiophagus hannah]